jgi:hypothetical protein
MPLVSSIIRIDNPIGEGLSLQTDLMDPGDICSKPTTSAQSTDPDLMRVRASASPVDPVAQALFVLYIGILQHYTLFSVPVISMYTQFIDCSFQKLM